MTRGLLKCAPCLLITVFLSWEFLKRGPFSFLMEVAKPMFDKQYQRLYNKSNSTGFILFVPRFLEFQDCEHVEILIKPFE